MGNGGEIATGSNSKSPRRAVFLDRDGGVNALVDHSDAGVIDSPMSEAQFELLPRVPAAIRQLNKLGLLVIIVSNQPAVARRRLSRRVLKGMDRKLAALVAAAGARIDATYYCLHHPGAPDARLRKACACRKPGIGMLTSAAQRFGLSLKDCFLVGDNNSDIIAGSRAGCKTIFIGRCRCAPCRFVRQEDPLPDFIARDLWSAARIIREQVDEV